MNFYDSALITLVIFTALFYLHWNRIDKVVDEALFSRFLFFGVLLGIVYAVLFVYAFFSLYQYIDLMLFSTFLLLPAIATGGQLSILSGKYKLRKDILQLSSSLGGAFSLPVSFGVAMVSSTALLDYAFVAVITVFAFLVNLMSAVLLSLGGIRRKMLFFYNLAFLVQMLFSSSVFLEYLYGRYSLFTIVPEVALAAILYMTIFHGRLREGNE